MEKHIREVFNDSILNKAANYFGSSIHEVKEVGGFENFIYEYQKNEVDYILRLGHSDHRNMREVEAELDFVNFLALNKANVSIPVHSIHGKLVEVVYCEDGSYFTVTSYIKAKGSHVTKETATDLFFENYGKTIGQIHRLTKQYQKSPSLHKRYEWNEDILITEAKKYIPKEDEIVLQKMEVLMNYINQLPKNEDTYGLIHTDIHMGNFFIHNNELTVFDFDDCSYQYFVSDIAISLFYYLMFVRDEEVRKNRADQFMKLFMKGYLKENQLDPQSLNQMPYFLKLREFILFIVVYRSCDLETNAWAQNYLSIYKDRILNDIPFVDLDFSKYINL